MSQNRAPTEKQYERLCILAGGAMVVTPRRSEWAPLLRREWVATHGPSRPGGFLPSLRITPEGLRALAKAVERYGLPDLGPQPSAVRRVCAECGSDRHRVERVDVEIAA